MAALVVVVPGTGDSTDGEHSQPRGHGFPQMTAPALAELVDRAEAFLLLAQTSGTGSAAAADGPP